VSSTERLARALDIKAVDSGSNLILLTPYDDGVFYEARDYEDIRVVSPIQAYLDVRTSANGERKLRKHFSNRR